MTWVKDSDDVYHDDDLRDAGATAALYWSVLMRESARRDSDGILSPRVMKDAANLFDGLRQKRDGDKLLEIGRLHRHDHRCSDCRSHPKAVAIPDGQFILHGWWRHQLEGDGKADEIRRWRNNRRKQLNRPHMAPVREAVRRRDRDLCRYCGVATKDNAASEQSSGHVRTLDHRDPWGPNTVDNLRVACKRCNGWKNNRTPEQAGMVELDAGTTAADLADAGISPAHVRHHRSRPKEPAREPARNHPEGRHASQPDDTGEPDRGWPRSRGGTGPDPGTAPEPARAGPPNEPAPNGDGPDPAPETDDPAHPLRQNERTR